MMIKKHLALACILLTAWLIPVTLTAQPVYEYHSYPDDPLNARIYTLDNGLRVYLSVHDENPRIQTYVAVRVGSKHDPAETTGLAHYFEHLMFKGTSTFGTTDWESEKPLLNQIEALYEQYRNETDEALRAAIYRQIDSVSYAASYYAIPNEYDRLMTAIGSTGTNAGTSNDYTFYVENIPANQLEHWAKVQGIRFSDPVIRLFHTELETVYEEYNMSMTNDRRLVFQAMNEALYPRHPYAQQTTLGDPEHLKNPSITNIKAFYKQYYVPNNMAVVMAGDFCPDEAIEIIDRHFGHLEPGPVPAFSFPPEPPITEPVVKTVEGLGSANIEIGWRFEGAASEQIPYLEMVSNILGNGRAGLVDQHINKPMRAHGTSATTTNLADYSVLKLFGRPRGGQTMDEVRDLLLEQVEVLKSGDWPDWMMEAAMNNLRLQLARRVESTNSRARDMAMSFMQEVPYEQTIGFANRLAEITKEEVVAFAREHLRMDNYAIVYKKQVDEMDVEQVEKPPITPIHINRDARSNLLVQLKNAEVPPIEPEFIDYENDLLKSHLPNGAEVFYVQDESDPTYSLAFTWEMGHNHHPYMPYISSYFNVTGTGEKAAEEISNEFYILATTYSIRAGRNQTRITLRGLKENMETAMGLLNHLIWEARADEEVLAQLIDNIKTSRRNSRRSQQSILNALDNYATYGPNNPTTEALTNEELDEITAGKLIELLHELFQYEHHMTYTGPHGLEEVKELVGRYHRTPNTLLETPEPTRYQPLETHEERVFFAHYDASQSYLQTVSKSVAYDPDLTPLVSLYNRYFSGGMNAIVFQEMREKRGLAYMASARFTSPSRPDAHYLNTSVIATQNDKVVDAYLAFNELFNDMPLSEPPLRLAQEQIISNIRTQRIRGGSIINSYLSAREMGLEEDMRRRLFQEIPRMRLDDLAAFNAQYIKDQPKTYIIMGHENVVDFDAVEKHFGPVTRLSADDLFPY